MLELDGQMVMRDPWSDRRKRLEDIFENQRLPRVGLAPVTDEVATPYELWAGVGGEGRAQGAELDLPAGHPHDGLAEGEAEAHARRGGGGRLSPGRFGGAIGGLAVELQLRYRHPRARAEVRAVPLRSVGHQAVL